MPSVPSIARRAAAAVLAVLLLAAAPARAQYAAPAQPDTALRIILLTMGPGDAVWERFGHNAIWVHDPARGTDLAYNYGMFDFAQQDFLSNFIKGKMLYWMDGFDARLTLDHYRAQNRTVWGQTLNLAPAQAAQIRDFLEWNARPENRFYRYDYYRDNCSTRVRDVVDRALGGILKRATDGVPSSTTYRWHTRRLTGETGADVPVYTGLMSGLGPAADRPISRWEEMFLPMKLRDGLRAVRVRDAHGAEVPLVAREQVLVQAVRPAEQAQAPEWLWGYLAAGLALAGVLAFLGRRAVASRGARTGLAVLGTLWALFAGIGGVTLAGLWAFTDHEIAYRNENLFQLSPLAIALVVLLPALAFGARWAARPARMLAVAIAALSALGLVLQVLPGLDQVNGPIIALALPVNLAVAWAVRGLADRGPATRQPVPAPARKPARAAA